MEGCDVNWNKIQKYQLLQSYDTLPPDDTVRSNFLASKENELMTVTPYGTGLHCTRHFKNHDKCPEDCFACRGTEYNALTAPFLNG
jgi:hypothetical protein